ncbi:MAG: hypothetical protein KME23_23135 [Goleter apudmare HA4340-LM2]|nr:hypothetical protein [Goleter apudmare HA4340-LM2]
MKQDYLDLKVNYQETGSESDIRQIFESLKQSQIAKVFDKYDAEDSAVQFQEILDIIKTQPRISDESQQVKKWLEEIQKPQIKLADCTMVWCEDCVPGGCWTCI